MLGCEADWPSPHVDAAVAIDAYDLGPWWITWTAAPNSDDYDARVEALAYPLETTFGA